MFAEGAVVTAFGILALTVLRRFEDKNDHLVTRHVSLVLAGVEVLDEIMVTLKRINVVVHEFDYDRRFEDEKKRVEVTFDRQLPVSVGVPKVIAAIEAVPGVRRVQVARSH
jgi:putative Mg2+ transporter-C (MgtC) family protein